MSGIKCSKLAEMMSRFDEILRRHNTNDEIALVCTNFLDEEPEEPYQFALRFNFIKLESFLALAEEDKISAIEHIIALTKKANECLLGLEKEYGIDRFTHKYIFHTNLVLIPNNKEELTELEFEVTRTLNMVH